MHGIGAVSPDTSQMLGQEEYDAAIKRGATQGLKRLFKAVMGMNLVMGLELTGVTGFSMEPTCEVEPVQATSTWLWFPNAAGR